MTAESRNDPVATMVLVRRAKAGDREAWGRLVERYYRLWIGKYRGQLGAKVRKLYSTEGLVHSAIADAIHDLANLKNDGAFFAWVTSIIRHKLAKAHRRLSREAPLTQRSDMAPAEVAQSETSSAEDRISGHESYLRSLDVILKLFPVCPEEMSTVYLRFLEGLTVPEIVKRLGRPRRTVYRWLRDGTRRLQKRLSP